MHELALMESIVDEIASRFERERVGVVRVEIGDLSGVDASALRFCFGVCARGTALEGAALDIVQIPALAMCRRCRREEPIPSFGVACTCGSFDRDLRSGDEIRLKEVEVL